MHKHHMLRLASAAGAALILLVAAGAAHAAALRCPVTHAQLRNALVAADTADSSGFDNHYWGVVVNHEGVVCAVAFSGRGSSEQWIASRQIAAAKAFTAYGLSLDIGTGTGAFSTAQLYNLVQPGNIVAGAPLFGLAGGNELDSAAAYGGDFHLFGTPSDPMVGHRVGGTITFGGGLALYFGTYRGGGLGISGDTACSDHSVAWRTRKILGLEQPNASDKLTIATQTAPLDGHPNCFNATPDNTKGIIFPHQP
jgi:uncharacterized protein GlcG (DUF336 family)